VQILGRLQSQLAALAEVRGDVSHAEYRHFFALALAMFAVDVDSVIAIMLRIGSLARRRGDLTQAEGWYRPSATGGPIVEPVTAP
jgi:hypothetical protein